MNIEKENLKNQIENLQNDFDNSKNNEKSYSIIEDGYKKLKTSFLEFNNIDLIETYSDLSLRIKDEILKDVSKSSKIVLYIPEGQTLDKIQAHRYHFYNCSTMQQMRNDGKNFKYHISQRKEALFQYRLINNKNNDIQDEKINQELYFCQNCLKIHEKYIKNDEDYKLNFKNGIYEFLDFFNKAKFTKNLYGEYIFNEDINEYELIESEYLYDFEAIPNIYSKNWDSIARSLKTKNRYKCQECGWNADMDIDYSRKFIHVHHMNYKKFDNNTNNLKVLCIKCHSNQKNHSHIKKTKDFKEFLKLKVS
ncbi:MAG: hypothetical protein NTW25_00755 [Candidatus Kapabacteria bacterium]|nr:hypothetical protein [Candidatus Kapabacteria bacterium]